MENSRRHFLKSTCALVAGVSVYPLSSNQANAETAVGTNNTKYAMLHDETKCIGCNACVEACREVNHVPEGVTRLSIERLGPFGEYPNQFYHFTRRSCQHCEDAPCVNVCPTGAAFIDKETGIVSVNADRCVGCQYCIAACPYEVRFINPVTKAADKCDFCRETNLKQGKQPACVEACPTKALVFGNLKDPESELVALLKANPTQRSKLDLGTRPKLFRIKAKQGEIIL
ncbi:cytochrome c nitrite reductase Fe-S protein [Shewanella sp. Actino-trap-3]|jgi:protein NrfC|uniref:4Fe-4S dicluster domain-containing protein n=1 Tax=Shewanella sp. Actino-trap-3 TaxID=2058331 RepID=UPI000C321C45|nr:4Fe-4S dicluster domain-containing protein [Shewanella sp. Actino-trap-3]PKG78728.1 cytochrome c nitrite reductase Fe-S protein [Shewanella sp. Actino-trap-3]|tara:strand:+ start:32494 stop:33180 length:687 start_codon:yes stop_codon:yes gene_type:complete